MRLFEELNRLGTTIVVATHNMQLVRDSRHPELRLEAGALVQLAKAA
jgi:cell division transport system ATP-binding protein